MSVKFHDNIEQRSPEWYRLRLGKIGGTRLKQVFASNNLPLVDELIAERLTLQVEEPFVNAAMQHGIDTEPLAIQEYEAKTGATIHKVGYVTNSDYPHCGLSPDGFVGSDGAVEIKCPSSKKHIEYVRTNRVPADYKHQVLMYFIMCPDVQWVDFVSFDPRVTMKPINIVRVERIDVKTAIAIAEALAGLRKFTDKLEEYYDQITF